MAPILAAAGAFGRRAGLALLNRLKGSVGEEAKPGWSIFSWAIFGASFFGVVLMLAVGGGTAGELTGVNNPKDPELSPGDIPPPSGDCAGIASIAIAEYNQNVVENPPGSNSGGRIDLYTDNNPEFWCADFVSWVLWQSGNRLSPSATGGVYYSSDRTAGRENRVSDMINYFRTYEGFLPRGSDVAPGDIIFYDWVPESDAFSGHTGIVVAYDPATRVATTIEGNRGNRVNRIFVRVNDSDIVGFGRLKSCQAQQSQPTQTSPQ